MVLMSILEGILQEVRELLNDWREEIDDSELIFLRCSKSYYRVFMGYDDAVLTRGELSLHSVVSGRSLLSRSQVIRGSEVSRSRLADL